MSQLDKDTLDAMSWDEVKEAADKRDVHFTPATPRADLTRRILESLSPDREGEPVSTMVASPPTGPVSSVSIGDAVHIDPETEEDLPPEITYSFWVGTTDASPFQNITCGITFPKFMGAFVGLDEKQEPGLPNDRGTIVRLTEDEFEMVKRKVANTVIRPAGTRSIIKNKTSKRYRRMPGDTPVGKYLYMRRIGAGMRYDFNTDQPETMVS